MREFYSPRTQWFSLWRFRRLVLPVVTLMGVYGSLSVLMPGAPTYAALSTYDQISTPQHPHIVFQPDPVEEQLAFPIVTKPAPKVAKEMTAPIAAPKIKTSSLIQKTVKVGRGDTLMDILTRNHVPQAEARQAVSALKSTYDPRDLNVTHKVTLYFNPKRSTSSFDALSIQADMITTVRVKRTAQGEYKVETSKPQLKQESRVAQGVISDSLFVDAQKAGLSNSMILDLIKMYSFAIDFQRDLQPGDRFQVMYRVPVTSEGRQIMDQAQITYARLYVNGRDLPLYAFKDSFGTLSYYDEKGETGKKPLMKTPVDGARLSSGFGVRRHPVLGFTKMHKGVDFAAPRGTPIYAAGDGVIEKMGPFSTYGLYVRIRHRAGLQTAYAHMQKFKAGLFAGSKVKQGQVIGYIGTTGRSTGPHLHYEVIVNHHQVNPAAIKLAGGGALMGKDLKKFRSVVSETQTTFRAALASGRSSKNRTAALAAPVKISAIQ